jgi:GH15 family glucan-1,4-alpha-glucosidase
MPERIEDYALIGNRRTTALVGRSGSIDWLSFPHFDSPACMAALLGSEENGRWLIGPKAKGASVRRSYRAGTLVLETEFSIAKGAVLLVDTLDTRSEHHDVLRVVRGLRGYVEMRMELIIRSDYGMIKTCNTRLPNGCLRAVAGPDQFTLAAPVAMQDNNTIISAEFAVENGQEIPFALTWSPAHRPPPEPPDVHVAMQRVEQYWRNWSGRYQGDGPWSDAVLRSLITLQALTDEETGATMAAPTLGLPEELGGSKNWDYRYCWLRDATFALSGLMDAGYKEEAKAWRQWLLRAVAGSPDRLQIMYGRTGTRHLKEFTMPWLKGYEGSTPVRAGNAASQQFQLDVYGELMDFLYQSRCGGLTAPDADWELERALVEQVQKKWRRPGSGFWEVRGEGRQFTQSKVMAWVAADRAIRMAVEFGMDGPVESWRDLRSEIHEEVCRAGFNPRLNSFVHYYGSNTLDASLLLIPLFGFLPPEDERVRGTIAAVEKHLLKNGFVIRYHRDGSGKETLVREGAFLACSFWLVDNYVQQSRLDEAQELFDRLLAIRNDVGLLSEEYDTGAQRFIGNFPQALSHVALIRSADNLKRRRPL